MTRPVFYEDDDTLEIELMDKVKVTTKYETWEGFIAKIHPRLKLVTIKYEKFLGWRTSSKPRYYTERVPISQIDLISRDGVK